MGTWMDPEAEYYRGKVPEDLMRWSPPLPPRTAKNQVQGRQSAEPTEAEIAADTQTITDSA
jgi:hypothetical protein